MHLTFYLTNTSLSKPHLKVLSFIITGMLSAESIVTSDISRKLKDDFSLVNLESIERRFRRFFLSFSSIAYSFYDTLIKSVPVLDYIHFSILVYLYLIVVITPPSILL